MNTELTQLYSSLIINVEMHPRAKSIHFWSDLRSGNISAEVNLSLQPLSHIEAIEVDLALAANALRTLILPNFYQLCVDIEAIFHGAQPSTLIDQLAEADIQHLLNLSRYAQSWQSKYPGEVKKLLQYVLVLPVYSQIWSRLAVEERSELTQQVNELLSQPGNDYLIGCKQFQQHYLKQSLQALSQARQLVFSFFDLRPGINPERLNSLVHNTLLNNEHSQFA
ncbi:MAG TPA: hypothetical protein ENI26_00415 [Methylophaga aminisulfidivorans]|uniref:Uncharacterized protein n=2 Tax=root TaxID=1 RepID=A0A7C1VVK2_9GAMM|nr:hypothetical protein [Methylophaga aminisulfidivorans]HEC72819.1 hypothetical protein [Methylophaga aminisulfidivorans]